jgi:hypothetical protein
VNEVSVRNVNDPVPIGQRDIGTILHRNSVHVHCARIGDANEDTIAQDPVM